ncbi:MAG: hypothetical protein KAW89_02540 [Armatimonadetes bacterium]|nr:hypothetical protein [Armatimonadota bacterium]
MSNQIVFRQKQRLDHVFELAKRMVDDDELSAHFAKYLCVLASGFIEVSVRAILEDYARRCSNSNVSSFVSKKLERYYNLNWKNILKLVGEFSPDWERRLEACTDPELQLGVDSIVSVKNQIAHGKDHGISYGQIKQYYKSAVKVVKLIGEECR